MRLTGEVVFRGTEQVTRDGRRVVVVFGVLAVPDDFPFRTDREHRYPVSSTAGMTDILSVGLQGRPTNTDLSSSVEDLLEQADWRLR